MCRGRSSSNARSTMPSNDVATGTFMPTRARLTASPKNDPVMMMPRAPVSAL